MFPISFKFTVDEGTTIYIAKAMFNGDYRIIGPEVNCSYTMDEVFGFIKKCRWLLINE